MRERHRPDMEAPATMREGVSGFESSASYRGAMERSAFDKDGAEDAAPIPDELPPSFYERTINLRYWGAALFAGALLWVFIFMLL